MDDTISELLDAAGAARDADNHIEAARLCELILAQAPMHVLALNIAGMAAAGEGDGRRAYDSFAAAIEADPDHSDSRKNMGTLLAAMGKRDLAAEAYRDALTLDPANFDALNCLGLLQLAEKHLDAAADSFRRALEVEPRHQNLYLNLANALATLGRRDDAVAVLSDGVRLMPEAGDLRVVLSHMKAE